MIKIEIKIYQQLFNKSTNHSPVAEIQAAKNPINYRAAISPALHKIFPTK